MRDTYTKTKPHVVWRRNTMKSYNFKVVIESDDDRWHAYCPALKKQGASTWGNTPQEALKHIQEVIQMIVEELIEDGEKIPEGPKSEVDVLSEPWVEITV